VRVVAQVEQRLQFARDDVVGAGAGVDVADLQAGGGKLSKPSSQRRAASTASAGIA